jgi:Protein of unknown function (DUF1559)
MGSPLFRSDNDALNPMRDLLVRYLLGELDEVQQHELEEQLRSSPELQRELARLRACFSAADDQECQAVEPPSGLAERTAGQIAGILCGDESAAGGVIKDYGSAAVEPPSYTPKWSMADLTVAGGVFLAVAMLFVPALRDSRDSARRRDCQNNLRQMGVLLASYAEEHNGYFPRVSPADNAGMFAVHLVDEGYIEAPELARLLVCRSSALAEDVQAGRMVLRIPNVAQLRIVHGTDLAVLRQSMGGSYAYRLGYVDGNRYYDIRNDGQSRSPLMADAPSFQLAGFKSANHRGCGQNVLYQDQSVHYQTTCTVPGNGDHLFLNTAGIPAAGRGQQDTVLGRSELTPGIVPLP